MKMEARTALAAVTGGTAGAARAQPMPPGQPTPAVLMAPGPEARRLAGRVGVWDLKETTWADPGAAPVSTTGLVAERVVVGSLLQEYLRPPTDQAHTAVARTDLLSFDRIEGCWKYVSFDTRSPLSLMVARSDVPGDGRTIELVFEPYAALPAGTNFLGQMRRMVQTIVFESADRDAKEQYFLPADGSAQRWLAHRYVYSRRG